MKKTLLPYITIATALTMMAGGVAYAQELGRPVPPQKGEMMGDKQPMRTEIRDDRMMRASSTQMMRREIRDARPEGRPIMASTTAGMRGDMKAIRAGGRDMMGSTTDRMGGDMRDERMQDRERMASSTDEMRGEMRGDKEMMRMADRAKGMWIKMNATIVRLGKLIEKLDNRITKVKSAGNNTTVAESASADAKTNLTSAQGHLTDIRSIIATLSSTTPDGTASSTLRAHGKELEMNLKTAQDDIQKAVESLKGLKANENAGAPVAPATN